jgi:iron complex transport system substrate-binding protein
MTLSSTKVILLAVCALGFGWVCHADQNHIVSLDYCADQFTLGLAPREAIAALSMDAERGFSYMRAEAKGLPQVKPSAENVLAYQPTAIIRSYGGGPNAKKFYENLGIRVIQVGFVNTIAEVRAETLRLAEELGNTNAGKRLARDMDQRLAAIQPAPDQAVLYVTPGGVTSGTGTLVNELIEAAGLSNFQQRSGWHSLPLEELTLRQPELLATAFYNAKTNHFNFWSAARHPMIRRQFDQARKIELEGATTACGGWFLMDAIETLSVEASS